MQKIDIPVVIGPGSQPAESDGAEMSFMDMPSGMFTYEAPLVPEPEEIRGLEPAIALTEEIGLALQHFTIGDSPTIIELDGLNHKNRNFFNQLLGEGEVSVQCQGNIQALIQESVLAGMWRVQYIDQDQRIIRDTIEIADIPGLVREMTFNKAADNIDIDQLSIPEDVYNAPPLLAEIHDKLPLYQAGSEPFVINLSLLPHSESDLVFLSDCLGIGPIVILSRGYGNCRISSTSTRNVWWVQYFNSQENLILNTLEICQLPEVARAAQEDIDDSAERLAEILGIYR